MEKRDVGRTQGTVASEGKAPKSEEHGTARVGARPLKAVPGSRTW